MVCRRRAAAAILPLALLAAACGSASGAAKVKHGVPMVVTIDHGHRVILRATVPYGSNALLDIKRDASSIGTLFGGRYVSSIDGHSQSYATNTYWIVYVNCVASNVGAAEITVEKGDTLWWDLRHTVGALPAAPDPACPFRKR
jgi:hypothetical protein